MAPLGRAFFFTVLMYFSLAGGLQDSFLATTLPRYPVAVP